MANTIQTEIGQLSVELMKAKAALKEHPLKIFYRVLILFATLFWVIFAFKYGSGALYKILSVVFLIADGYALAKSVLEYAEFKIVIPELERKIAEKRMENL